MGLFDSNIVEIGSKIIDKFVPDASERARNKIALQQLIQNGEFHVIDKQMDAIVAEANSSDKWTSRARPAFLYVMYTFILAAIPMGILYAVDPIAAADVTKGVNDWLEAIPEPYIQLFGMGYLGYVGGRSFDKNSKNKHGGNG